MVPHRAVLAAFLLVASLAAVPPPANSQEPDAASSSPRQVAQMAVPNSSLGGPAWQVGLNTSDATRSSAVGVKIDIGAALTQQYGRAGTALFGESLRAEYDAASTDDERFAVLSNATDRVRARLERLDSQEHRTAETYATGSITAEVYLDRLTRIEQEAVALQSTIEWIESSGTAIGSAEIVRRSSELRTTATLFTWPIREQIADSRTGSEPPIPVHVTASRNGFVLTAITDGDYVREARRFDRRAADGSTNDIRTSIDEIYATYPAATADLTTISVGGERSAGVFYATIETRDGVTITTFIDNRNLRIFQEVYRASLEGIRTRGGVQKNNDGVTIVVARTGTGGPMSVEVHDREADTPIDARVTVEGSFAGRTGADGRLWLLDEGGSLIVTARTDTGNSVTLSLDAREVNASGS